MRTGRPMRLSVCAENLNPHVMVMKPCPFRKFNPGADSHTRSESSHHDSRCLPFCMSSQSLCVPKTSVAGVQNIVRPTRTI
jgi:hypothetical protein